MQGNRDEGEAVWRSTDVGAAIGIFEVPNYMPCYKTATTADGGKSPHQEVCYLISYFDTFVMPFVIHHACVSKQDK